MAKTTFKEKIMDKLKYELTLDGETKLVEANVLAPVSAISSSPNYNIAITKFFCVTDGNSPAKWNGIYNCVEPDQVIEYTPAPTS